MASKKSGNGTYEWKDGTKYEGEWKDDQMWGMDVMKAQQV